MDLNVAVSTGIVEWLTSYVGLLLNEVICLCLVEDPGALMTPAEQDKENIISKCNCFSMHVYFWCTPRLIEHTVLQTI